EHIFEFLTRLLTLVPKGRALLAGHSSSTNMLLASTTALLPSGRIRYDLALHSERRDAIRSPTRRQDSAQAMEHRPPSWHRSSGQLFRPRESFRLPRRPRGHLRNFGNRVWLALWRLDRKSTRLNSSH